MKKIAVLGEEEFTLGFQLTGISKVFKPDTEDPVVTIKKIKSDAEIGVVITQEKVLAKLPEDTKEEVNKSIQPIFVTLSRRDSNTELQKLIKKSIGIDVWNKGE